MTNRSVPLVVLLLAASCRVADPKPPLSNELRPEHPTQITSGSAVELFPAFSSDGLRIAYSSNESGAFEIYARSLRASAHPRRITSDGKQNLQPSWSPDDKSIAYHSKVRGGIWVIPASGGSAHPLTDFGTRPAWSPDGQWIAFQVHPVTDLGATSRIAFPPSTIWVVPARGGPARQVTKSAKPAGGHGNPVFTADGKHILFATFDSKLLGAELWSIPSEGGEPTRLFAQARLFDPAVSSDGRAVFFGDQSPDFHFGLWRRRLSPSGQPLPNAELVAQVENTVARHPTVSPDGRSVVWSALQTAGNIWSISIDQKGAASGTARALTRDQARSTWPIFSPSGQDIAYGHSWHGRNPDIWTMKPDGRKPSQITTNPSAELIQDWLPDGRRISFMTDRSKHAEFLTVDTTTREEKPLPFSDPDVGIPRLSPDATRMAYQSKKGSATINVWIADLRTGERKQLTYDREFIGFPCWSPDGKSLAVQVSRGDDAMIAVVPSDGGDPVQLTFDRGLSWPFSWSPDGDKILFAGSRQDRWAIWWVSRSTREQHRVTPDVPLNVYVRYPSWSPRGDQIVYEYGETTGHLWLVRTGE